MSPYPFRCLMIAHLLWLGGCSPENPASEKPPAPRVAEVRTLVLQPRTWQHTISVYGTVEAAGEVEVSVDFSGTVQQVWFREGQKVGRGALLLELDSSKQALRLERARSVARSAKAALEEARNTLARRRSLAARSAIAKEALESSEIAVRQAAASYDDALAALGLAERALADCRVHSPVAGVVERREVEPGETVLPGQVLGTLQAMDLVRIATYVSERDVNYLSRGDSAEVTSLGARGRRFSASIESVGIKADPRTGNFPVKLALPNPEGLLRPGMTARLRLQGLSERNLLLIPDSALVDRDRERVVFVLRDGKARAVRPQLGDVTGALLPVLDGLAPGDRLIVSGLQYLVDGSPVRGVDATRP